MATNNEVKNLKKAGTGKSALAMVAIGIAVIALIGVCVWILMNPDILQQLVMLVIIVVAVLILIGIIIAAAYVLLAIPMYVAKGEQYQDGVDYSLDDVKPVKESSSEDPKN